MLVRNKAGCFISHLNSKNLTRLLWCITAWLVFMVPSQAENISANGILLLDEDKQLTPELVLQQLLNRDGTEITGSSGFAKHEGNYWYAAMLNQPDQEARQAIRLANAHFRVINLYLFRQQKLVQEIRSGYREQTEGLHSLSVDWIGELVMEEEGEYQVVLNIASPIVSSLNVNYESYDNALITSAGRTIYLFFMIGITVSLAVHNLLFGLSVRDYGHILYAIHSLFGTLFVVSAYGLFKTVFGFYDYELLLYKPASVGIQLFGTWFCYVFLKIPNRFPRLVWAFKGLILYYFCLLLFYPLMSREVFSMASAIPHPFFGLLMLGSAWAAYRDGLQPALYLFIGWTALIIGSTLPALATVGLVPSFENILLVGLSGHVFEMYMLSLAISQKFRSIQLNSIATNEVNRSRSAFISYFSHEVKTPIVGMLGLSKMLKNTELTQQQGMYVEKLYRSGNQLLQQLNSVLLNESDQSKPPKVQATSLLDVLETATVLVEGTCSEKGVEVHYSLDPSLPAVVDTDPNLLQQVVNNLVSNAAKYTDLGGINIRCEKHRVVAGQLIIRFSVGDTGIGIPYEDQDRVFDAFTMASNNDRAIQISSGMGLAVVKRICERMGASISFQSTPGVGSVFNLDLPVVVRHHDSGVEKKLSVLVVDDVELNTEIMCSLLADEGHTAVASSDPTKALQLCQLQSFDAILVDIHMPVLNGEQFFVKARGLGVNCPVIGISAGLTDELSQHLQSKGMALLMEKPFSMAVFYNLLNKESPSAVTLGVTPAVNPEFLNQLSRSRSSAEIESLFNRFCLQCDDYVFQLNAAIVKQDEVIAVSVGHRIAGLVASFGLNEASNLAKTLNTQVKQSEVNWGDILFFATKMNEKLQLGIEELRLLVSTKL